MTNRRESMAVLLGGAATLLLASSAVEAATAGEAEALRALNPWADALFSNDPKRVAAVLGEEYQILRSDGTGFDKAGYLQNLPKQKQRNTFSDIHATRIGPYLVLRYVVASDQVIAGKTVTGKAPRLSTFRAADGGWLMSSHANFAQLG